MPVTEELLLCDERVVEDVRGVHLPEGLAQRLLALLVLVLARAVARVRPLDGSGDEQRVVWRGVLAPYVSQLLLPRSDVFL